MGVRRHAGPANVSPRTAGRKGMAGATAAAPSCHVTDKNGMDARCGTTGRSTGACSTASNGISCTCMSSLAITRTAGTGSSHQTGPYRSCSVDFRAPGEI